ncbi:MAG TPA: cobyrinate a,c-diamide synthase [Clostridiales bacterium]|nr:cobyrinate a,c-diamide synthase [Clostridiales bacterium]
MMKTAFVVAAVHSGGGKTTVTMGLMAAFRKLNYAVQPFKVGPDYIDPMYHTVATGRKSRNLDSFMVPEASLPYLFVKNGGDADIAIVEGVMGLYDGVSPDAIEGSSAHIAQILNIPVILVLDGHGMSLSVAALIKGFQDFSPATKIAGVILNRVKYESGYLYLKEIIEAQCGLPVFGYLPEDPAFALASRHLGLYCSNEIKDLEAKLDALAEALIDHIDLGALQKVAAYQGKPALKPALPRPLKDQERVSIGYAYDAAFNFYYQDNLDLLRELGAELIPVSPLKDKTLPTLDGLLLGGGYPELHLKELSANTSFKENLKQRLEEGMPCYAECGGLIYLGRSMILNGETYPLTGFFPFDFAMTDRLQHFGYMQAEIAPHTGFSGEEAETLRGHEFHFTKRVDTAAYATVYDVSKKRNAKTLRWQEGFQKKNVLGGYPHFHFYSNPTCAANFLENALKEQKRRK